MAFPRNPQVGSAHADDAGTTFRWTGSAWAPQALAAGPGDALTLTADQKAQARLNIGADAALPAINAMAGSEDEYTLVLADAGKLVSIGSSEINTFLIPTNASVAFPISTRIDVVQAGEALTSFAPQGGVTLNSRGGARNMAGQFAVASLFKTGVNTWLLTGDIASA